MVINRLARRGGGGGVVNKCFYFWLSMNMIHFCASNMNMIHFYTSNGKCSHVMTEKKNGGVELFCFSHSWISGMHFGKRNTHKKKENPHQEKKNKRNAKKGDFSGMV